MGPGFGRNSIIAIISATFALASISASAADMPKRKSGLWQIKMSMAGMPAGAGTMETCIDEKSDDITQQGQVQGKKNCDQVETKRDGDRVSVHSVCRFGKTTATSDAMFTGHFDAAYRGEIRTVFSPAMAGRKETRVSVDAKWLGPCKPGQRPGDIMINGQVFHRSAMGAGNMH
jgi:Protein of unknown function (DUF3617)